MQIAHTSWCKAFSTPVVLAAAILLCGLPATASAQELPAGVTPETLAKDNKLFMAVARKALKWDEPTEPSKIVGPLFYVGTAGLASYLFVTSEGHILFNTGMPESGPMIVEAIRKLGFDPKEIKIMITGTAIRTTRVPLRTSRS